MVAIPTATMTPASKRRLEELIKQTQLETKSDRADILKDFAKRARQDAARQYLIDELHQALQEAKYDSLSGAVTRTYYDLNRECILGRAESYDGTQGYLLFDVDNFKSVNDTYGHPAGDDLLRTFGREARATLKELPNTSLLVRNGGDEFLFIIDGVTRQELTSFGERFSERFRTATVHEEYGVQTLSGGIAMYDEDGTRVRELLALADRRLYNAKRTGGDQVHNRDLVVVREAV